MLIYYALYNNTSPHIQFTSGETLYYWYLVTNTHDSCLSYKYVGKYNETVLLDIKKWYKLSKLTGTKTFFDKYLELARKS